MSNKPANAYVGREAAMQVTAINFVRRIVRINGLPPECVMHVPNGGARSLWAGSNLKAAGVVRGYPDIMVFAMGQDGRCGLAFELKVWPNKTTSEQEHAAAILRSVGWHVLTCWSLDAVISATNEYFAR